MLIHPCGAFPCVQSADRGGCDIQLLIVINDYVLSIGIALVILILTLPYNLAGNALLIQ